MIAKAKGSYYGGLNNVLKATRVDDLPPAPEGFESIADAADKAMREAFAEDLSKAGE